MILVLVLGVSLVRTNKQKMTVLAVERDGQLRLSDGSVVRLTGVRIKSPGEEGYEAGMFLLKQMTETKEVWVRKEGAGDYSMWIGCVNSLPGITGCGKALLINDELVRVGVAEKI